MADTKITDLTALTAPVGTDLLVIVDLSDTSMAASGTDKKITVNNLFSAIFPWTDVTGTTQSLAVANGYIADNAALVTMTLPATAAVGDIIQITGYGAGGWKVAQNASQYIIEDEYLTSTTGTGGYIASKSRYASVVLQCVVANNGWLILWQNNAIVIN